MERPQQEDIAAWQGNNVTKYFLAMVKENLEDIKDGWADGSYIADNALTTVQLNSSAQGTAHALQQLIDEMRGIVDAD